MEMIYTDYKLVKTWENVIHQQAKQSDIER